VNGHWDGAAPGEAPAIPTWLAERLPPRRLGIIVAVQVACAALALALVTAFVPLGDRIALPFDLGVVDPAVAGVAVWIVVGLLTSARSSRVEGRVALIHSIAPLVAAGWLGGPTAAAWVALLGTTERRELTGQLPWYGVLANHAEHVVPAIVGAFAMAFAAEIIGGPPNGLEGLAAVVAGSVVLIVLNYAMALHVTRERTGRSALEAIGPYLGAFAAMPFAEAALGWAFAEAYVAVGWWVALVLVAAESTASSALALGQVEWFARHDTLTGLPNRRAIDDHLRDLRRRPPVRGGAVFVIDLDRFKPINEAHGHAVGDLVLQEIATRLAAETRAGDLAARLGGDEFVYVATGVARKADAESLVARLRTVIESPVTLEDGLAFSVGASIGYTFLAPAWDLQGAIRTADDAMLKIKHEAQAEAA
jgi:diguanylate cyclase (GGDEF)-like protein